MTLAQRLKDLQPKPPRILVLDIETSPATAFVWGLRDQNISPSQLIEPSRVLCFAAKWATDKAPTLWSEWEHGRKAMIAEAWRLLDEADIVVGFNHARFDIPHLQREMVQLGYRPPSPWIDVDLLPVMRRRFRWMSNKLGYVVDQLGLDSKMDAGGFATWRDVLAGDANAQARMGRYCKMDTQITHDLFEYVRPWLTLPHAGLFTGNPRCCAACGSERLGPDGIVRTKVSAWLRLACADCGALNKMLANGETRAV